MLHFRIRTHTHTYIYNKKQLKYVLYVVGNYFLPLHYKTDRKMLLKEKEHRKQLWSICILLIVSCNSVYSVFCLTLRHISFFTGPMQFILSGVFISRIHHGSHCSCRMHKYSISTILIPESYHLYAGGSAPVWGAGFLADADSFSAQSGLVFKGQPISPLTWLVQIKSALRRSLAVAHYHWRLLEFCPHRATAGHHSKAAMLITVYADQQKSADNPWDLYLYFKGILDVIWCFFGRHCKKYLSYIDSLCLLELNLKPSSWFLRY